MELGGIRSEGQERVFLISTTHGAETHAMAAALATIREFQTHDVIGRNHRVGVELSARCERLVRDAGLDAHVEVVACPWMPTFVFKDPDGHPSAGLRTLFLQEMIARGVLFQGIFVPCFSHTPADLDLFAGAFAGALEVYRLALRDGYERHLVGPPVKPVFRRFN
jgi:glutamate-1-semialdehyde aminotransferase